MKKDSLPNFYKVSDELFRGAQPCRTGFKEIKSIGIRTIINLRWLHSDQLRIRGLGFKYFHISCKAWHPEREDVQKFLRIMLLRENLPAFVHCQHGADRTGLMVAAYRIFHHKWEVDRAIDEMTTGPFGFHKIWENIPEFLEKYK